MQSIGSNIISESNKKEKETFIGKNIKKLGIPTEVDFTSVIPSSAIPYNSAQFRIILRDRITI